LTKLTKLTINRDFRYW